MQMESHPWRRCSWSDRTLWQTWMFFLSHEFCDVVTFEGGERGLERVMMNVLYVNSMIAISSHLFF